ncbi:hypothetical protein N657DRAFT_372355 [Parathielavia appendiculata]|uniref:Uncharacterized protein n=1 Tax=Parathielavia appendiculata TaxID=2587402 RepID=A0AAN6TPY4_9PEZI|nr:hypothetical protein N657DRAFT_372355 [Parathielavia appendiculata]
MYRLLPWVSSLAIPRYSFLIVVDLRPRRRATWIPQGHVNPLELDRQRSLKLFKVVYLVCRSGTYLFCRSGTYQFCRSGTYLFCRSGTYLSAAPVRIYSAAPVRTFSAT